MPTHFFRVDGADQETGEETYLVLQADTKPHAEKLARQQGLLIASVRVAKPADWQAAPAASPADEAVEEQPAREEAKRDAAAPEEPSAVPITSPPEPPLTPEAAAAPSPPGAVVMVPISIAVVLACVGGALIAGGIVALVLALMPRGGVLNELQQLDARLHELTETVLACMLVLSGFLALAIAAMCYLAAGEQRAAHVAARSHDVVTARGEAAVPADGSTP